MQRDEFPIRYCKMNETRWLVVEYNAGAPHVYSLCVYSLCGSIFALPKKTPDLIESRLSSKHFLSTSKDQVQHISKAIPIQSHGGPSLHLLFGIPCDA